MGVAPPSEQDPVFDVEAQRSDLLDYRFERRYRTRRKKSPDWFRETIRGQARRIDGTSLESNIADVRKTSRSWFEYFMHAADGIVRELEGWTRMRPPRLLRRWQGMRGRGGKSDHQVWTSAYFAARGLLRVDEARSASRRSAGGWTVTREPCAGDPQARFGGGAGRPAPYPPTRAPPPRPGRPTPRRRRA